MPDAPLPVPFFVVDSFTRTRYAGNPAGVLLPDTRLPGAQMQAIAGELHLESAFAVPSATPDADFEVAYYTGAKRIPLCGHDTIALAMVLAQLGRLPASGAVRLRTDVGVLAVTVGANGEVTMAQALPVYGQTVSAAAVADALGLPVSEIEDTGLPVQVVSTGTPFVIVPVMHRAALNALAPNAAMLTAFGDSLTDFADGFYVWSFEAESGDALLHARCFCPAAGLPEDPVTGTASGAVGAHLTRLGRLTADAEGIAAFRTEQGYVMGRPGNVDVQISTAAGKVTGVAVSGTAVLVGQGTMWV